MKSIASHPIPTQLPLMLVQFPEDSLWVRLGSDVKTPLPGVPWRSSRPTYPDLQDHVDHGGNVNATWSGPGGTGGDYRGLNGYAALHGDELAVVDAGLSRMGRGDGELPIQLLNLDRDRIAERSVRRVVGRVAQAFDLFDRALSRATAQPLTGAVVGSRHPAMVGAMAFWGGRRHANDGRPRTFGEVEASGILAWVLAARRRWHAAPHKARWLAKQANRGRKGAGVAREASLLDTLSNEAARPWKAEGVSRATWYRRRAGA